MRTKTVKGMLVRPQNVDPLTPKERSTRMALVRATRNKSTEMHVAAHLVRNGIRGWQRNPPGIVGRPDFYFPQQRIVVFVDGCFWHGCPTCKRNTPRSRREFWQNKIATNRRRDRKVQRLLRAEGYRVVRIWEHALSGGKWLPKLLVLLAERGR
jgi:DNA mismatch endonuclease (patch repair protein)